MTYDLLFSKLLRDCVDQADPGDTGIPSPVELPRFHQEDQSTGSVPCLVFIGTITGQTKRTITLGVDVIYRTHPAVEGEDPRADLVEVLDAVGNYLADPEAWAAFLLTDEASVIPDTIAILQRTFGEPGRTIDGPNSEHQHLLPVQYVLAIGLD